MKASFTLLGILIVTGFQSAAYGSGTPAQPVNRNAPEYPEACMPAPSTEAKREEVVLVYDVNSQGRTENIRISSSTNSCFNDAAIAAVETWTFTPRMVDEKPELQKDIETTVTFMLDLPAFGSRVGEGDGLRLRIPAQYPEKCMATAKDVETVRIRFDISKEGVTKNVEVVETTNSCFDEAAARSVERWRYRPKIVDGEPVERTGVETVVTFMLE